LLHLSATLRIRRLLLRNVSGLRRVLISASKWSKSAAILLLLLPAELIHLLLRRGAAGIRGECLLSSLE